MKEKIDPFAQIAKLHEMEERRIKALEHIVEHTGQITTLLQNLVDLKEREVNG